MSERYSKVHEVAYYECDVNQQMTLPSLIALAIKVSEEQSDLLERGTDYVHGCGLAWVITNYQIKITRLPRIGEQVRISTEATSYNKFFCYRNFWYHTQAGEELIEIEAVFVLMDMAARKMSSVPEEIIAPYKSEKVKKIKRYPALEKVEAGKMQPYRVRFYDIDSNQHVNNAVYFNWLLDILGYDFLTKQQPAVVAIRFEKEVEYGMTIESHAEEVAAEAGVKTRHEIKIGDEIYCEANILWR